MRRHVSSHRKSRMWKNLSRSRSPGVNDVMDVMVDVHMSMMVVMDVMMDVHVSMMVVMDVMMDVGLLMSRVRGVSSIGGLAE